MRGRASEPGAKRLIPRVSGSEGRTFLDLIVLAIALSPCAGVPAWGGVLLLFGRMERDVPA